MSDSINVLSAGAAKGLLHTIAKQVGLTIAGEFGAVGAMRERLQAGAPCDLLVLTEVMMAELAASNVVQPQSMASLGKVPTGVAFLSARPAESVNTSASLHAVLSQATKLYFPDPLRATAGIHFRKVLTALGLAQSHADRFATYPNGATAMRAMADAGDTRAVGVTQASEILYTEGVQYIGDLPGEHALATGYSAGLVGSARGQALLDALCSPKYQDIRQRAGFG